MSVYNYKYKEGIKSVLEGMNKRTNNKGQIDLAINDLRILDQDIEKDFKLFFDEVPKIGSLKNDNKIAAIKVMMITILRRLLVSAVIDCSFETLAVFLNPSGVTSYTQEKIIQIGKPIEITKVKVFGTQGGASKIAKTLIMI